MKHQPKKSTLANPIVILLIVAVILLGGAVLFLSQNKNTASTNETSTSQTDAEPETNNPTYGHIHSVFRMPTDGTILMGTHNGLFKSIDNGKTFEQAQIKSTDSKVNPDGEFMNFDYDKTNKILYAGTHDSGLLKSTDFGLTWSKTDTGIEGNDIHALAINPLDTNRIYAYSVDKGLFGTKDGAKSWYKIDDGPANPNVKTFAYMATPSSMDRGMKVDKTTNIGYLWAGTGGGLFSSFACFCGWTPSEGISSSKTVWALATDPVNKSAMLLAQKDGIYQTTNEGKSFTQVSAEVKDVGALWFDIENPKLVFAATNNGVIYISNDSGLSWKKGE